MDPETDPTASVADLEESAHKVQGIAKTGGVCQAIFPRI